MAACRRPSIFALAYLALALCTVPTRSAVAQRDCVTGCGGTYAFAITPDSNIGKTAHVMNRTAIDTFTITNTGTATDSYTLSCSATGTLSCVSINPSHPTVTGNCNCLVNVAVSYTVGAQGGRLYFTATSDSADVLHHGSTYDVLAVGFVAPDTGARAVVHNRQPIVRAVVVPNNANMDTTKTSLSWRGQSVTTLARQSRGLVEWEVDSTHWLGIGDSAQVAVTACVVFMNHCATATQWVVLLNDHKPVLGFTGAPLEGSGRQFAAPFGPGLGISGGEVETGIATPPYFSSGIARSAALVYSTRQSYPRALIPVDVELTWPANTPTKLHVTLFDSLGVRRDSVVVASPVCSTGSARRCRVVLQGDFSGSSIATPVREWLTVQVQVDSSTTTQVASDSVEAVLVDRRTTIYGSGWWLAGVPKLVGVRSDRLLIGANGAAAVYRGNGDSVYVAPPGSFTSLVKTSTGWELHPRGSTAKLVFDSNGRLSAAVDQNGNRDSVAYNLASDQVLKFVDSRGQAITLANGNLSTITDPGGRVSKVRINMSSHQLTADSLAGPSSRTDTTAFVYQSYTNTNTVVLTKTIGVITDTTIVTYDSTFNRRPSQVRLAQVKDETGSNVNAIIAYTAYERQGYHALRSLDSVYVQLKDPRNNWTRSLLNRWGESRKSWDSLSVLSQATYTPEGLPLWAEGKVADSSRAYHAYDSQLRLVRDYVIRAAGDTLRLDSLIYDASSRVIRRIGLVGDTSRVVYDANGNVTRSITPTNDTTRYAYASNGLLAADTLPGNTVGRGYAYDNLGNLKKTVDESGTTVDSVISDAMGRDTMHLSKLRVQIATGSATQWQWRRLTTYYNSANQVDSTRLYRTVNCNDPCNTPPSTIAESLHVRHRFDRAGRDSLRTNDLLKSVLYFHDRLGRLTARYPWADSISVPSIVRDSFAYDIAGNLKKTITRRGDTFTTDYDSRNRDTLTVIPGVGTLMKTYAGPLDQLNRAWYSTPVDPIGGVVGTVAMVYDKRGRLIGDTSFTGSVARVTTHTYDSKDRPSTSVDALGTWTMRYETARGYVDSLITPMGDTISYTFDAKSRAVGPYIHGGGRPQSLVPAWDQTGSLNTLTQTVSSNPSFIPLKFDRQESTDDPQPTEAPVWTEQEGAGVSANTLKDSLTYDGWGRLATFRALRNGVAVDSESFSFDRNGNISGSQFGPTYDATTDRLKTRTGDACGTWTYSYDRAGNDTQSVCGTMTWKYQFDALNRMTSATQNGTLIVRYGYDILGRRIVKRVYSSATGGTVGYTRFAYRGANVGFETDSNNTTIGLRYTYGPGSDDLLAVRDGSGHHYYAIKDLIGSVRALVRRDSAWVMSQRFGPYGAVITKDTSTTVTLGFVLRYGWTGREYDTETGLYFFRARYYDPKERRFIQEDPIGYSGGSNVYAYGDGTPLAGSDPSGLMLNYDPGDTHSMGHDEGPGLGDPFAGGGANPFGDDPEGWAELFAFEDRIAAEYSTEVVTATMQNPNGTLSVVQLYVLNGHFDPTKGHETDLVIAIAAAAAHIGLGSVDISSIDTGHGDDPNEVHNKGDAMDVSGLDEANVSDMVAAGTAGHGLNGSTVIHFMEQLVRDGNLPVGARIMGPYNIGMARGASQWYGLNMLGRDTRVGLGCYLCTWGQEHNNHIHVSWTP
jgi:RHS repeat-associated protein